MHKPDHSTAFRAFSSCIAALVLSACSLRIPVEHEPVPRQRVEVSHSSVKAVTATDRNGSSGQLQRTPDVMIWLTADEYHTGMIFPFDWLKESGYVAPRGFGNPRYVVMSWGNQDAYSEVGIDNPWKMFRVLFTPTRSVMELIPTNWNVVEVCPKQRIWRKLVPRETGPQLARFLNACARKHPDGTPLVLCKSSWGNGVQIPCEHSYFIPRVCNIWTVQTLEATGGHYHAWLALTANGLIRQAEAHPNDFEKVWGGKP